MMQIQSEVVTRFIILREAVFDDTDLFMSGVDQFHGLCVIQLDCGLSRKIGTIQRRLAWPLRKDDTRVFGSWLSNLFVSFFVNLSFQAKVWSCRDMDNYREVIGAFCCWGK
jgi:hypothetical protein